MKIARIFRHTDGRIYVCNDAAPGLSTAGGSFATKAAAMRGAIAQGYTHARGSGTYRGNELTDLHRPYDLAGILEARRREKLRNEVHTQLDLDGAGE